MQTIFLIHSLSLLLGVRQTHAELSPRSIGSDLRSTLANETPNSLTDRRPLSGRELAVEFFGKSPDRNAFPFDLEKVIRVSRALELIQPLKNEALNGSKTSAQVTYPLA